MGKRIGRIGLVFVLVGLGVWYYTWRAQPGDLVLTGMATTDDVIVSSLVGGQIGQLAVESGQSVRKDQVIAVIVPDEVRADQRYFEEVARGASAEIQQNEAAARFQEQQLQAAVQQAQASLAAAEASRASAEADLENARLAFTRNESLLESGVVSREVFDLSRTAYAALQANVQALAKQAESARTAVALAQANAEQIAMRQGHLQASRYQSAAATAQQLEAGARLAYTEVRAPITGIVDVRVAREGEVVTAGQPIVTLINPDDLWIRADLEETYIDRVRLGDHLRVRLPSGTEVDGTVFYRGADGGFATPRDVSRTKRDIKTFEIRLRVDNRERRLAVGMTAYVLLPVR